MRQWKRQAAVLTAGVILTGTAGTEPAVFKGADAESICSVKAFAEQFSAYSIPEMLCDDTELTYPAVTSGCTVPFTQHRAVISPVLLMLTCPLNVTDGVGIVTLPASTCFVCVDE